MRGLGGASTSRHREVLGAIKYISMLKIRYADLVGFSVVTIMLSAMLLE
jgi:hypothetical protein